MHCLLEEHSEGGLAEMETLLLTKEGMHSLRVIFTGGEEREEEEESRSLCTH
jgi:hypothetical protein